MWSCIYTTGSSWKKRKRKRKERKGEERSGMEWNHHIIHNVNFTQNKITKRKKYQSLWCDAMMMMVKVRFTCKNVFYSKHMQWELFGHFFHFELHPSDHKYSLSQLWLYFIHNWMREEKMHFLEWKRERNQWIAYNNTMQEWNPWILKTFIKRK